MIKLQDFAKQHGVTDRAIQKHLKKHEKELEGHFFRRGPNGTWLDEKAQEYIKSLMIIKPVGEVVDNGLLLEIKELKDQLKQKEQYIIALEAGAIQKQELINKYEEEKCLIEEKTVERIHEAEENLKTELEKKYQESEQKLHEKYGREIKGLQDEIGSFQKGIFGFYRKKRR